MNPASSKPRVASLKCMEIRGGSRAVEEAFDTPGLDAWLHSRPFEGAERGGDLHYVSVCGGGVITRVIVADVSGHGARVAEFSEALRALMRKNINTKSQTLLVKALELSIRPDGSVVALRHRGHRHLSGQPRDLDDLQCRPPAPALVPR